MRAMAIRIQWTEHEEAVLLFALIKVLSKELDRKQAIREVSGYLRKLACEHGIVIDDKYRNENGIALQMSKLEFVYTNGKSGLHVNSGWYFNIVQIYRNDSDKFKKLLGKVMEKSDSSNNNRVSFSTWINVNSPERASKTILTLNVLNTLLLKRKIIRSGIQQITDIDEVKNLIKRIDSNKGINLHTGHSKKSYIAALGAYGDYLQFLMNERNAKDSHVVSDAVKGMTGSNDSDASNLVNFSELRVSFTESRNYSYTRPSMLMYFDKSYSVNNWTQAYVQTIKCLYEDYPDRIFSLRGKSIRGEGRVDIADNAGSGTMLAPKKISDDLFLETNESANDIVAKIGLFLKLCNVDYDEIKISYASLHSIRTNVDIISNENYMEIEKHNPDGLSFYDWLTKFRGMSEGTGRSYDSAINTVNNFALEHKIGNEPLRRMTDIDSVTETVNELFSSPEFVEINRSQHNRFRAALRRYIEYLGGSFKAPYANENEIQKNHSIADIDIRPYKKTLLAHFQNGYRLDSSIEAKKFRRYFVNINGYVPEEDNSETERIIKTCGIEYDGRIYLPESMLSDEIKNEVIAYIDKRFEEGASMVYFEALFHQFSDKFLDFRIYNAEMLRQYLASVAGNKYVFEKNYLSLEHIDEADPIDEISSCLKENILPLQIEELSKRLPHIPEDRIRTILGTHLEFVRNSKGEYFHADSFDVTDEELDDLAALINEEIRKNGFISGNELYDELRQKFPYIYEKNAAFSPIGCRDALKYKFNGRFSFNGNVISAKDKSLSMSDVFTNFGKNRQSFTLEEVLQLVDNIGSKVIYFDALYENSARVSEEKFVRADYVNFNVKETDSVIDRFCSGDYVPITDIRNFGIFPNATYPWNEYLLENYLSFHSKRFTLLHTGYNINTVVGAVVKRTSGINDYDDLLARVMADSTVPLKKESALSYLVEHGYIGRRSYKNIETILINARAIRNRKEK